eukprot:scaffold85444_cov59-Phaeocystis_antarctica.AAC.3
MPATLTRSTCSPPWRARVRPAHSVRHHAGRAGPDPALRARRAAAAAGLDAALRGGGRRGGGRRGGQRGGRGGGGGGGCARHAHAANLCTYYTYSTFFYLLDSLY